MRLSSIAILATAVLVSGTAAGFAEPAATPDAAATAAPATAPAMPSATGASAGVPASTTSAAAQADTNPIVCHVEEVTGSRLGSKRLCYRQSEWDSMRRESQHDMYQWETHNPPGGGH
ncbi:MAG TPA: hypothetical protein VHU18_08580 [Rhizomicrobium sp.]|nr:hypothetical protein [Rhizomicrobium sp.]